MPPEKLSLFQHPHFRASQKFRFPLFLSLLKPFAILIFSLAFPALTSFANEITLTPKDGKGEPIVIKTSEKSEVILDGKTYLVQPKAEPATMTKAKAIKIPRIDFADVQLETAILFLTQRSIELDSSEGEERGLNIVAKDVKDASIPTLQLRNLSIFDALGFMAELTDTELEFRESAIVFSKKKTP